MRAEDVEHMLGVGPDLSGRPLGPGRLGHQTGQLAIHVRVRGEGANAARPRFPAAVCDRRLGGVVEDEAELGMPADRSVGGGQLRYPY
jgi:hypothetical protein